jgi:hypothetical protein
MGWFYDHSPAAAVFLITLRWDSFARRVSNEVLGNNRLAVVRAHCEAAADNPTQLINTS